MKCKKYLRSIFLAVIRQWLPHYAHEQMHDYQLRAFRANFGDTVCTTRMDEASSQKQTSEMVDPMLAAYI